ncbi:CHY zinc finger protein [Mammaliicoccus sp. Dog046]|uniref:CHY zinc finger protein n=1 Tax=Mammaliicoccus sp. Dog046 TaxID=3034233 RepID=UPI002B257F6C|nr:CHY zinc finger protein [Mammaliicoccus sp. Dog046]WQK86681.1 CHY zinc finger protein [Mammaliicoccus sp. Dog046]
MEAYTVKVYGLTVDNETRCEHYQTPLDIIAIKFKCCNKFYPCYKCHDACENHEAKRWNQDEFNEQAILCGVCNQTMSINEYMMTEVCPHCDARFNDRCKYHHHLYFKI